VEIVSSARIKIAANVFISQSSFSIVAKKKRQSLAPFLDRGGKQPWRVHTGCSSKAKITAAGCIAASRDSRLFQLEIVDGNLRRRDQPTRM
jgi:hypothetical protein